jgi:single-strand DNA-binding protein
MKTITIAGRLTKDAEMKRSRDGDAILQFSVAVDDFDGKDKTTIYFDVALFGKRAQSLEQHLVKGTSVAVAGDFSTFNADSGKTYLKVRASSITLLGGSPKREEAPQRQQPRPAPARDDRRFMDDMGGDEIPFMYNWK